MRRAPQWYESAAGAARLQLELDAVEGFNRSRAEADRVGLAGKRLSTGHLAFTFAFRPLDERRDLVRGELLLSSRHPHLEPVARIDAPPLARGAHVIHGLRAREIVLGTIPASWARAARARCPCLFRHDSRGPDAWRPELTAVDVVLNLRIWFLNYVVWLNTGRWPFDRAA